MTQDHWRPATKFGNVELDPVDLHLAVSYAQSLATHDRGILTFPSATDRLYVPSLHSEALNRPRWPLSQATTTSNSYEPAAGCAHPLRFEPAEPERPRA